MENNSGGKKPFYKRWWFILLMVMVGLGIIGSLTSRGDKKDTDGTTTGSEGSTVVTSTTEATPTTISYKDMTDEQILESISMGIASDNGMEYMESSITPVEPTYSIVKIKVGSMWDEDHLMRMSAECTVDLMEQVFMNTNVSSVKAVFYVTMIDAKGNESESAAVSFLILREEAKDINYDNFKDMVIDYNKLIDICEETYIHPGVKANLKDLI